MGFAFDEPGGGFTAMRKLVREGLFAVAANNDPSVLQFKPPLITSDSEAEEIVAVVSADPGVIAEPELVELHGAVERALERGHEGEELNVIGWGEISLGVGWPADSPEFVAKRLPAFSDRASYEAYAETLGDYVRELEEGGVSVVETEVRPIEADSGVIAYALQPILPADTLGPKVLGEADPAAGHRLVDLIVDASLDLVSPHLGLDPQLSNWSWTEAGGGVLFDVTTPFLRDDAGRDRMDFGVLLASFPWIARGVLRRFVAPSIIAQYHDPRTVIVDVCGNLIKERLEPWIPCFLERANPRLSEPIAEDDVRDYYRSDARTWEWIQRARHADRAWHRLRGRTYPFLIPGEVER